ncbi:MAG: DUF5702 domain-containing protein [Clostridiales Family XIII bacterium]|jgi:hypothetical protein|nr:DUF5702 domain-containing protein [Clostridiales Family XIII bacterium]
MKKRLCAGVNKKGATAVFLVMILASLLLVAGVLIRAAGLSAAKSCGDAVFQLAGRSLLAEYDRRLFEDYGLFGMRSDEADAEAKLKHYSEASLKESLLSRRSAVWLLPCAISGWNVDLKSFSLADVDIFEEEIVKDIKFTALDWAQEHFLTGAGDKTEAGAGASADAGSGTEEEPRQINNEVIINNLPSKGIQGGGIPIKSIVENGLPSLTELFNGATRGFYTSEYIFARFTHAGAPVPAAEHERFFKNEAEYVIIGKYNDAENLKQVYAYIRLLRFVLNEASIHKDSAKLNKVRVLAASISLLTQGVIPELVITEVILAVWTAVETGNDIKLLQSGGNVALLKNEANWAIDLSAVSGLIKGFFKGAGSFAGGIEATAEASMGKTAIQPSDKSGLSYEGYLRIFLYFTGREIKLLRIMDLIQINMKVGYYEAFLLREHYAGIRYEVTMNGDRYSYVQRYYEDVGGAAEGSE